MEHLPFKTQKALVAPLCVWETVEDPLTLGLSFEASSDLIADSWGQAPARGLALQKPTLMQDICPGMPLS